MKTSIQNSQMKNNEYFSKKINSLIPGGAHTYSRGDDQFLSDVYKGNKSFFTNKPW